MQDVGALKMTPLILGFAAAALQAGPALAEAADAAQDETGTIEEVVVIGRFLGSAESLIEERKNDSAVMDILGAEAIKRLGDSTVAEALRRVAGLSLVQGKFVYVRGLGERYSSSVLNGALIPSPDLTRNVIPLDIFPTSVVESLRIQKSCTADMSANFGGGAVDIRTKVVPDDFTYSIEVGLGHNTEVNGNVISYSGGGDDNWGTDDGTRELSRAISGAIDDYQGSIDPQSVFNKENARGNPISFADAQQINRELALNLYRNIGIKEEDSTPDYDVKASLGNNFYLGDDWEVGFLAGGSYKTEWRQTEAVSRNFNFPTERTDTELETMHSTNISGIGDFGVRYTEDHEVAATVLWLRNTDDETAVRDFFNENREVSDGVGFREYRLEWEEHDMLVIQFRASHRAGAATKELLRGMIDWLPDEAEVSWYYSDATANTEIPNRVSVTADTVSDPLTGLVLSSRVAPSNTAGDWRFTDLDDDVKDYGWSFKVPFYMEDAVVEISGGGAHNDKTREYQQTQLSLGALSLNAPLDGSLTDVFADANVLDPANQYVFDLQGTNNQSYLAATMTEAAWGQADWTWRDTWRLTAGVRWEDYKQVGLDWDIYAYSVDRPQISTHPELLRRSVFRDDDYYPSVSLTYMSDWLAETFQLRFGYSQTLVRPDLREITDAGYVDPRTGDIVSGNSGVVPSDVTNYDVRAEWFFANGDSFTASAFYKDLADPIELFESAASDTSIAREIVNAEAGEVYGVEFEWLKSLGFIAGFMDPFFLQGNLTLQDSELTAGTQADAPTNPKRKLAGASDYVANVMLGYDSPNGHYTGSLIYNVFGERLYVAGRNGAPDGFEQPFQSLDLTYSWYPTELITVSAKAQNLLDDEIEIERAGVTVFTESPGTLVAFSMKWEF